MIDLDSSAINWVRIGKFQDFFHQDSHLNGKEECSGVYSKGFHSYGPELSEYFLDGIRKQVEKCSSFQGFMIYNSTGGGTGAGLGSLLLERLSIDFGALPKISCPVYPSDKLSSSVLEPYNSMLHTTKMLEYSSVVLCFDNVGLYNRCSNNLGIEKPSF